jgi:hypothetical protein
VQRWRIGFGVGAGSCATRLLFSTATRWWAAARLRHRGDLPSSAVAMEVSSSIFVALMSARTRPGAMRFIRSLSRRGVAIETSRMHLAYPTTSIFLSAYIKCGVPDTMAYSIAGSLISTLLLSPVARGLPRLLLPLIHPVGGLRFT